MSPRRELFRVTAGTGEPVVLVHGSWTDHTGWLPVHALLAEHHHVITYDRRGHSRSGPVDGLGSRRVHEDDLIALVEELGEPAHLVGNSYGGSIVLGVAARRPDVVRTVAAHEPPLVGVAHDDPVLATVLAPVIELADRVGDLVRQGQVVAAVERFVDDVALGPGAWAILPPPMRDVMVANAPTFTEMLEDPDWALAPTVAPSVPMLLSTGDASPAWLPGVAATLADAHRHAAREVLAGAGHVPHLTHPDATASMLLGWFRTAQAHAGAGR